MKKIFLALMTTISVSFASYDNVYFNGKYYSQPTLAQSEQCNYSNYYSDKPTGTIVLISSLGAVPATLSFVTQQTYSSTSVPPYYGCIVQYKYAVVSSTPTCSSTQKLVDGVCVDKTVDDNDLTCDPLGAQYKSTATGKCTDCMPFVNLTSRAFCACDALGSSYTPQPTVTYYYTSGNYTYKKTRVTCDDGTFVAVYNDPVNNNSSDYNSTTPSDNNSTTPDTNTTTPTDSNTTTPTTNNSDVVKAVNDSATATTNAVKSVDASVQSVNTSIKESNLKLDNALTKLQAGNDLQAATNTLLGQGNTIAQATQSALLSKFSDSNAHLKNLIDASLTSGATLNDIRTHTAATANAVNTQGTAITGKLDDVIKAIKDSNNSTDMTPTNDLLKQIQGDTNGTAKGVDKLHDDLNSTNDILGKIKGMFDNNDSYKTPDVNQSSFSLSDLLPDEGWFETNKLTLNFNNYGGDCYCQTAEFTVAGKTFIFPPQEALDVIPFTYVSNIFMAFIFVLGAKDFLRD